MSFVIGFALLAFILGDFLTKGGMISRRNSMTVAKINGKRVLYPQFEKRVIRLQDILKMQLRQGSLDEQMNDQARTQAWQELLQDMVYDREYERVGLDVSKDELSDMIQGPNPHPFIRQNFTDPETGKINRVRLSGFLQQMAEEDDNSDQKKYWLYVEEMIYQQRLATKYNTLVSKGLYVTKLQAEEQLKEMDNSVDFSFIQKPYSSVSDSIDVSEKEIKEYYKLHKEEYKQEESRDLQYVAFDIIPSKTDYKDAQKWINDILPEYEKIDDVPEYVHLNSDTPYDPKDYKKGELPDTLDKFMFSHKLGAVYGPYFQNNAYKLAKLAKISYLPDSVRVSDIRLPASQNDLQQVKAFADSLIKLAKSGKVDFATLARDNSRDKSARNGGDIGWVKEGDKGQNYSDTVFYAHKGDIKLTYTQDALHIVKVTDRSRLVKKVQVGILTKMVVPSSQTDQIYYSKASAFAGANNTLAKFEASTKSGEPEAVHAYGLKPLDQNVQGLEKSRKLVRWAFKAEEGQVCPDIDSYGSKYVVAVLVKVHNKGYKPMKDVQASIILQIKKKKKADKLIAEMKPASSASSIDAAASKLGLSVQTATSIRFTSYAIPSVGPEPKIIAAALTLEPKKVSQPLAGDNGVYIIYVDNKKKITGQMSNIKIARQFIERDYAMQTNNETTDAIKDLANIEDFRHNFF